MKTKFTLFISALLALSLNYTTLTVASDKASNLNYQQVDLLNTDDFSDLASFGEAIKDKQIIYLDELTHGENEVFALKNRLIKYLHQHHDFEVVLLESGLFDVREIWKNKKLSLVKQGPGNIFFGYANNIYFQDLLSYIDNFRQTEKPLYLSGFDGRLSGATSQKTVVKTIEKYSKQYLTQKQFSTINWKAFNHLNQQTLNGKKLNLSHEQVSQHVVQSYQLIDLLKQVKSNNTNFESPYYWARILSGLTRSFENRYDLRRHDEHDYPMADNLEWFIDDVYKDKKVIVWGHYIHVNKLGAEITRYDNAATLLNQRMHKKLKQKYGDISYHAHFSGISGTYREFRDNSIGHLPKLTEQSFERQLLKLFKGKNNTAIFINPQQAELTNSDKIIFGHEYAAKHQIKVNQWQQHFDGTFFIKEVSALE